MRGYHCAIVKIFPFLVSKTPILSDPSNGAIKEKSIFILTEPPFGFNPCGRKTCILVSVMAYLASFSVATPFTVVITLTDFIL